MRSCSIAMYLIALCLGSLAGSSFGELVMIRQNPRQNNNSYTLTCVTDDYRAALVWNDDIQQARQSENNRKVQVKASPTCATSGLENCNVHWENSSDWQVVNSVEHPMGPAFDSRWEDFRDIVLNKYGELKYVRQVPQSGAVVFSARALRAIRVILCASNSCTRITIPGRRRMASAMRLCFDEKTNTSLQNVCNSEKESAQHGELRIDPSEWRTFTLTWDKDNKTIKLYRDLKVFSEKRDNAWSDINHLFVRSFDAGLIRFHFYQYLRTEKNNTKLFSNQFAHSKQNVCFEILVSLCVECKLEVSIVGSNDGLSTKLATIYGNTTFAYGELPAWQIFKFNKVLPNLYPSYTSTLEIHTVMSDSEAQGWWAIDSFQICKREGTRKFSTITFSGLWPSTSPSLPIVGCQQLSYTQNTLIKSDAPNTYDVSSSLQECEPGSMSPICQFGCNNSYAGTSICDQFGCTCAPGFTGSNCDEHKCPNGFYGYNCEKPCGFRKPKICDKTTGTSGTCISKCEDYYLPPKCETMLRAPNVSHVTASTAVLSHPKLDVGTASMFFRLKCNMGQWTHELTPNSRNRTYYKYVVHNLHPHTWYSVQAVVKIWNTEVEGPSESFTTGNRVPMWPPIPKLNSRGNGVFKENWHKQSEGTPIPTGINVVMSPMSPTTNGPGKLILIWIVIILILLISFFLLFTWREECWNAAKQVRLQNIVAHLQNLKNYVKPAITCTGQQRQTVRIPVGVELFETVSTPQRVSRNRYSHSVNIEDFEDYVKASISSGRLRSQFMMFRKGMNSPCKYGSLPENKSKNRYMDILPYDNTRVVLTKTPGDSHSDYINANYVHGFHKKKAYIAAQGPKPQTVVDFWRMIWQEGALIICMLANVVEGQKAKCEQYWPEIGDSKTYGDIIVLTENHRVFADYTFRTFRVSCKEESRKIEHLHYTGWPDHTVPIHSNSVVAYLKQLQTISVETGPIVVHCSAGVGRTGTIILCDICLHRANATGAVDVLAAFRKLRDCRLNMVDNELQYLFAHLVLAEYLLSPRTGLPCNNELPQTIKELRKQLPEHMKRLQNIAWQDQALNFELPSRPPPPEQLAKNRFPNLAPDSSGLVYLERYPKHDVHSDYISTVIVDGLKAKKQYVASQLPLPTTLSDFWRLIAQQRIELVIVLQQPDPNDPTCCDIIPGEGSFNPVPFITVEQKTSTDLEQSPKMQELVLTEMSGVQERTQKVTVLTCQEWGLGKNGKPPPPEKLVELWKSSENINRENGPTLVLCHDGITGCGLYLALNFLLERMAAEQECDVIFAIRAIRRFRANFVQSQEQFEYLYDAAVKYAKCFETYSNFT